MKKCILVPVMALFAVSVFAQDFTVSGEIKSGILWNRDEKTGEEVKEDTVPRSKDDAGPGAGRFRVNVNYYNPDIHVGFKFRINWEQWTSGERVPDWSYAFGYVKFWEEQFILSIGKLGASPWGTGGPEMWRELEAGNLAGIRFEYEPLQVPGLNVGFVMNSFDGDTTTEWSQKQIPMSEYFYESIVGVSYTHELFHARTAVRFDSQTDRRNYDDGKKRANDNGESGIDLVYRVEERALTRFLPGFKVWAMGYIFGIGASEENNNFFDNRNWLFIEYAPSLFTSQIRFGLDITKDIDTAKEIKDMQTLYIRPSIYFNLLDNLIKVGASFEYTKFFSDTGFFFSDVDRDSRIELKPLVQVSIGPSAYAALEYSFLRDYKETEWVIQNQWLNLRVGITF